MLFNSVDFALFLPVVFCLYWFVTQTNLKAQNFLILTASYFFYGLWDWRFLSLIVISTILDFTIGLQLNKQEDQVKRKLLLWSSISVNLGFLLFFKYYNFFLDNFIDSFSFFGYGFSAGSLEIILPVGISFYTFQTLSYTIDVYKKKIEPTKDIIAFSAFVTFFPQLVAGPIERANNLLPQFFKKRTFSYSKGMDGARQILWGLFKKIVIADNCAEFANMIFDNSANYSGSTLVVGAFFFTFQIYGDFSGYSDIAIGTSRLFGFDLKRNFAFPYFSRDIAEFWRRWHISLSTWFRDYLYFPLGGSRGGFYKTIRNTFIIFLVSGFWHGANWTFVVWGLINAVYFLPLLLLKRNRNHLDIVAQGRIFPSFREIYNMSLTFGMAMFAWVFFRAENLSHALNYLDGILSTTLFSIPDLPISAIVTLALIFMFLIIEWFGREGEYAIEKFAFEWHKSVRWGLYYTIAMVIFLYSGKEQEFIYFQF